MGHLEKRGGKDGALSDRVLPSGKDGQTVLLIFDFLTGCLVGWFYEEIFYWITEGMLRNRGILYGPWLPICGIGALGIYAMKPLKKKTAAAVCGRLHRERVFSHADHLLTAMRIVH